MNEWKTIDDALNEDDAETLCQWRENQPAWIEYEFRIVPSDWHLNGSFMIQVRKLA